MEPLVNKHGLTHKEALNHVLHQKGHLTRRVGKIRDKKVIIVFFFDLQDLFPVSYGKIHTQ